MRYRWKLVPTFAVLALLLAPNLAARATSPAVLITAAYYDTYLSGEPDEAFRLMNPTAFPVELVKKAPQCLEYIVVHKMVHLLERHHKERFVAYMDQFLPQWRLRRDQLNAAPLAHDTWTY